MTLPDNWRCPDTLAEITQPARVQAAVRAIVFGAALVLIVAAVLAW